MTFESAPVLSAVALVLTGIVAGFVNTLAGGGSLLTLPLLMVLGMPADLANGTNRVSVLAQSIASAHEFDRVGRLDRAHVASVVPITVAGALLGAWVASSVPAGVLKPVLVASLLLVAATLVYKPRLLAPPEGEAGQPSKPRSWHIAGLFAIGVYGGFAQAGVGILLLAYIGGVLKYDLVRGNALKTVAVAAFTAVALAVFVLKGQVVYSWALWLAAGTVAGGWLGVRFALARGQDAVRKVLFVSAVVLAIGALLR